MQMTKLKVFGFELNQFEQIIDFNKKNQDNLTPLMFALTTNKLFFKKSELRYLISKTDLNNINYVGNEKNELNAIINCNQKIGFTSKELIELIDKYPNQFLDINKIFMNSLLYLIISNNNINFTPNDFLYLFKKYPESLNILDFTQSNIVMHIIAANKEKGLNFNNEQLFNIIYENKEQLKQFNYTNANVFLFVLREISKKNINFTFEQLDFIVNNSFINTALLDKIYKEEEIKNIYENYLEKKKIILEKENISKKININNNKIDKNLFKI